MRSEKTSNCTRSEHLKEAVACLSQAVENLSSWMSEMACALSSVARQLRTFATLHSERWRAYGERLSVVLAAHRDTVMERDRQLCLRLMERSCSCAGWTTTQT